MSKKLSSLLHFLIKGLILNDDFGSGSGQVITDPDADTTGQVIMAPDPDR